MNRGQFRGIVGLKRACLAALCLGIGLAAISLTASATSTPRRATTQPDRSWENYFGVTILPSGRAVVVGDKGVVMFSDNQGKTWARQQLHKGPKNFDLYSVAFSSDGSRGWAVGDGGVIFRSDDHAETWSEQNSSTTNALLKVTAIDPGKACVTGEHGVILCTADGGANWSLQKIADIGLFDVAFTDPNDGWAVGEFSTVVHTTDGGKSWKIMAGGDRAGAQDPYFALAFDGGNGLAVGISGASLGTSDGGKTWKPGVFPAQATSFYTLEPLPGRPDTFYAAGENGSAALIARSQVSQLPSGTSNAIASAAFSPHFAIAVGLSGTLLGSDDGGQHWESLLNQQQALANQAR